MKYESIRKMVDKDFARNIRKVYPHKSFRNATKNLNDILEEMLYGTKKR